MRKWELSGNVARYRGRQRNRSARKQDHKIKGAQEKRSARKSKRNKMGAQVNERARKQEHVKTKHKMIGA